MTSYKIVPKKHDIERKIYFLETDPKNALFVQINIGSVVATVPRNPFLLALKMHAWRREVQSKPYR